MQRHPRPLGGRLVSASALQVVVPAGTTLDAATLAAWADDAPTARPFADETVAFCVALGKALARSAVAARYPEVRALAFWLREAPLRELQRAVEDDRPSEVVAAPRGTVFHVPPGNVDTVFVYSWLLAALAGNRNVVRLPSGADEVVEALCAEAEAVLADPAFAGVRARTRLVRYGHDPAVTAALSAVCDVRVLWGGDATVALLRSVPLPVHATEVTFPDRFAFALLDSAAVVALDEAALRGLADRFVTDAYWFDQMACSSPRLLVWRGKEAATDAAGRFFPAVRDAVDRVGYRTPLSAVLGKLVHAASAAVDEPVRRVGRLGNEVFTVELSALDGFGREGPGGGLFYTASVGDLAEVAAFVVRRDQTVTHFGFDEAELRALAATANGRGIDRLVPVGRALALHRFWDGFDLLAAFTRLTHVQVSR